MKTVARDGYEVFDPGGFAIDGEPMVLISKRLLDELVGDLEDVYKHTSALDNVMAAGCHSWALLRGKRAPKGKSDA